MTEGHPERSEGSLDPSSAYSHPQDDAMRQIASLTMFTRNNGKQIWSFSRSN